MAARIYKYPLELTDFQTVGIPRDSHLLSVGLQNDKLVVWALVDPDSPPLAWKFLVLLTGNPLPDDMDEFEHLGTVQTASRPLVWHVFASYPISS